MSDKQTKARALFLSAVMIVSVIAIGAAGFAGSAAADTPSSSFTDNTPSDEVTTPGGDNVTVADVTFDSAGNATNITVGLSNESSVGVDTDDVAGLNVSVFNESNVLIQSNTTTFDNNPTQVNLTNYGPANVTNISRVLIGAEPASPGTVTADGARLDANFTLIENSTDNKTFVETKNTQDIDVGSVDESTNDATEINDESQTVNVSFKSATGIDTNSVDISVRNLNVSGDNETVLVQGGAAQGDASFTSASNFSSSSNITTFANVSASFLQEGAYTVNATVNTSNGNQFQNSTLTNTAKNFTYDRSGSSLKAVPDSGNPLSGNEANISIVALDSDGNELIFNDTSVRASFSDLSLGSFSDAANVTSVNRNSNDNERPIFNTSTGEYNATIGVNYSEVGDLSFSAFDNSGNLTSDSATQTYTAQIDGVTVTAEDGQLSADGSETENVTLQLVDQNGNAIPRSGEPVSWGVISGNGGASEANTSITSEETTTQSDGTATISFNATGTGYTVEVRGESNNFDDTASFDTVSGNIDAGTSSFEVNGSANDLTGTVAQDYSVNVTLQDTQSNPVSDFEVQLTANDTAVSFADPTPVTNSTGIATTTVTLPETANDVQLNVTAGDFNASATGVAQNNVTVNAEAPVKLQYASDQSTTFAAGSTGNSLTVEAVDQYGNPNASGQTVTFESSDTGTFDFGAGSATDTGTLGADGTVTVGTLDANESAGDTQIAATVADPNITNTSATFTVGEPQGIDVTFTSDVSTSSNGNTNSTATLEAQLLGPDGSPIGVENENVSFARLSGDAAEFDQSLSTFETETDENGLATIQVNATSNTGQTEFLAQSVNYSASNSGTITTTGAASSISVSTNTSSVSQNGTVSVTASFVDSEGRTVPRVDSISVSSLNLGGTVNPGSNTTAFDSNGEAVATYTYTADGQTGSETLRAIGGGVTGTADVTVTANQSDTGSPLGGTAGEYDGDGDGKVTASELGNAVTAFGEGDLTASELGDVVTAFGQS
jgi:surface glycoprotein (TIGR04207 family)